jgi:hypothetical protein
MYGNATTQTRMQSETADSMTWARYAPARDDDGGAPRRTGGNVFGEALSRVTFEDLVSPEPLHAALHRARLLHPPLVVVLGRSRRLAVEDHNAELRALDTEHGATAQVRADVRKTVGDVGTAFVMAGIDANLLVMQASETPSD